MKSHEAIKKQIAKLQAQIAASEKSRNKALKRIVAEMRKHEFSIAELRDAMGSKAKAGARKKSGAKGKAADKRRKVSVKYRDKAGNTWSGRGLTPKWLVAAEKSGKKREEFLVK